MFEHIIRERRTKDGDAEFLIKWKGFKKPDWQPEANLDQVHIEDFRREKKVALLVFTLAMLCLTLALTL